MHLMNPTHLLYLHPPATNAFEAGGCRSEAVRLSYCRQALYTLVKVGGSEASLVLLAGV
jgi:hypothetical protein